ncbi:signal peptidase II [Streptomyces sp. J2-1]|uniref:signal peptidase II n=1 Tax=Streptomyces corallincola TaxID=2851888 RepID=UPI001C38BCEF|nr:signal peptidase II [Streptomyces corallincola]MBV2356953.1 signal peptidase II [Streptomyces corallincola]
MEGVAGPETVAAGKGRRTVPLLLAVAALAYAIDLGSKVLVVERLEHRPPVRLIGTWLELDVIRNPGAAFSMGAATTVVFTVIAVAVVAVIARLARKLYSTPWAIALGLLLGGALGNLTDRLFRTPGAARGAVVDFIAVRNFSVMNLADWAITFGGVLIVALTFTGRELNSTRPPKTP